MFEKPCKTSQPLLVLKSWFSGFEVNNQSVPLVESQGLSDMRPSSEQ